MDIKKAFIIGRITHDTELKYTSNGTALCKISLACNDMQNKAHYFTVNLWGKSAEKIQQYLTKGKQIAVEGELNHNPWEKDGVKHNDVNISAYNIQLLGGKE